MNWVVDYELVCVREAELSLLGTAFFAGFFLGSVVFLPLSDRIGRKPIVLMGLLLQIVMTILLFFVRSLWFLYLFCAILGIRMPMASHNAFVLLVEITTPSWRPFVSMYVNGADGAITLVLSFLYYMLQSWKPLFVGVTVMCFIVLVLFALCIPESPRFFIARNKFR